VTADLRQLPLEVARDTFLVRANAHSLGGSVSTSMSSLVIRAAQPVIVDTGMVTDRATFFEDVFSLVDPDDVRWIFLTHDDDDHSGNLVEALERCPNATVVMSWAARGRTCAAFGIPHERVHTVDHGQGLDVGDRTLRALRPPVYDNAYTRGVFDPATRVYFAADAFCAPMPAEPVDRVDEMPDQMWAEGFALFHHASLCPWITLVDTDRYRAEVAKLAALGAEVITSAHGPTITSTSLDRAFELLAGLPTAVTPALSNAMGEQIARHATTVPPGASTRPGDR
jgi:flavorubredoxin